ncbi:uncharacterized protein LOC133391519 [Anopheles gambiae]|uniref:uncharacterized protein LOC133391519 n=1 Tax=Anopheles gambiae TaxID=7165 RepID=UPI002AC9BF0A|nr:uncharacterized protein LOC133391519 [Anopheles gambiae]
MINDIVNVKYWCDDCLEQEGSGASKSDEMLEIKAILENIKLSIVAIEEKIKTSVCEVVSIGITNMQKSSIDAIETKLASSVSDAVNTGISSIEKKLNAKVACNMPQKNLVEKSDATSLILQDTEHTDSIGTTEWTTLTRKRKRTNSGRMETPRNTKLPNVSKIDNQVKNNTGTLIIIPKIDQTCDKTRSDMRANLDPRIHKITNFRNGKPGQIIVEWASQEGIDHIRKEIQTSLGEKYLTSLPTRKFRIIGLSENYKEDEMVDLIKTQNNGFSTAYIKMLGKFEKADYKYKKYNVIIEVDHDTAIYLDREKKINIGFDRVYIHESFHIMRCFKCGQFGHKSTTCDNEETCSKCSGKHKTSDCKSSSESCINCSTQNMQRGLKLNTAHSAFSKECPTFKWLKSRKQQLSK